MSYTTANDKPYPIRLGQFKPLLQAEAFENEKTLHYWIKKIIAEHFVRTGKISREQITFKSHGDLKMQP